MSPLSLYNDFITSHGLKVVSILAGAYVLYRILVFVKNRLVKFITRDAHGKRAFIQQRITTAGRAIMGAGSFLIILIALVMILRELGLDPTPILASAGVLGLAVSFGAQTVMKDAIAGLFILIEDQFHEGDTIKIGDVTGKVVDMTLRRTVLKDKDGNTYHIPNGAMTIVSVLATEKDSE